MNENLPLSPDDPRLTAYALEEMPPAERATFEKLLQQDPAARQVVAEIRDAGTMLAAALEDEPVAVVIPKRAADSKVIRFPQLYYLVSGLAAACFALAFVYWQDNRPLHAKQKQYVQMELPPPPAPAPTPVASVMPVPVEMAEADVPATSAAPTPDDLRAKFDQQAPVALALTAKEQSEQARQAAAEAARANAFSEATRARNGRLAAKTASAPGHDTSYAYAAKPAPVAAARMRTDLKDLGSAGAVMTGGYMAPSPPPPASVDQEFNTEAYGYRKDNDFLGARDNPLSTFSIDVDTAAYANVRRFLVQGVRPPPDAVRIEELVNYFPYQYRAPTGDVPFAANLEVASAPWAPEHRLVRIGLKGREVSDAARPAANLVFLLDVSGSMQQPNKLPLVKQSLHLLVDKLRADDRVAIAVYAGASGLALPSTPVSHKAEILAAIDRLQAEGSTNGAMGIQLAYDIAKANFIAGGVNRVILATDGDFNVGVTNEGDLTRLIEEKAKSGVFLSVLGFGMGNYKDATLESLADKGNGNYAYIDTLAEARKSLVEQAGGTLVTIAKDVKIQVEFNPAQVQAYRLIGYENRLLKKEDFNNDKVDAGEIGAGHTVTALYEVVPLGAEMPEAKATDGTVLKYQRPIGGKSFVPVALSDELLTVSIRYKEPAAEESRKLEFPLRDGGTRFENASEDFKFAAAVAGFGMILRDSPYKGTATLADVTTWGRQGVSSDAGGYRSEFLGLVQKAQSLQ
jgi:Ca-activated chloride channel family protein